jgi:hypothetical protein
VNGSVSYFVNESRGAVSRRVVGRLHNRVGSKAAEYTWCAQATTARRKGAEHKKIVGCDLHTRYHQIAMLDKEQVAQNETRRLGGWPRIRCGCPMFRSVKRGC